MHEKNEQKKDYKAKGDLDIGIHDYNAGGRREQLSGLWGFTTITGGSRDQRLSGCNYSKIHHAKYEANKNDPMYLIGEALKKIGTGGPPIENISEPRIVDTFGGFKR
jgi:hypothetical protein